MPEKRHLHSLAHASGYYFNGPLVRLFEFWLGWLGLSVANPQFLPADNRIRIVTSSWNNGYGVWDTVGREVLAPEADPTHRPVQGVTFKDPVRSEVGRIGVLTVSLDLNSSPSPAYNGGTMYSAPGGRRNRREQSVYLDEEIRRERTRWWVE